MIDAELDQIAEAFDRLGDGGTEEELLAAVEKYFGDLVQERDQKLDNYARFIAQREAYAKLRKAEADRLAALAKTDLNAGEALKKRLHMLFQERGWTKIETPFHKFAIANNGITAPAITDDQFEAIKAAYTSGYTGHFYNHGRAIIAELDYYRRDAAARQELAELAARQGLEPGDELSKTDWFRVMLKHNLLAPAAIRKLIADGLFDQSALPAVEVES